MNAIWKFELKPLISQEIEVPAGAEILTVNVINNIGYLWAKVNKDVIGNEIIKILIIPTGYGFEHQGEYLGTLFYNEGKLVQHVFRLNQ